MTNVGVIGLGMMGNTHLDVYARRDDVNIVAVSDKDPDKLSGKAKAGGNIEGQAQGGADLSRAKRYDEGMKLIADPDVELVDICLWTHLHESYARAAIEAGKHVLIEKPLAPRIAEGFELAGLADRSDKIVMPAMCMRFWPGWDWLKAAIDEKRYGKVRAAHFRRVTSNPGGPFYTDGSQCGGAILDLHIHDTDFINWCFGPPADVYSRGYEKITGRIDHVLTSYRYEGDDAPAMVTAEGGWAFQDGFGFEMQFTVNFEDATAVFDLAGDPALKLVRNGETEPISLADGMGYQHEIDYLLDCIAAGRKPDRVTVRDAAVSVAIVHAEDRSIREGRAVRPELP